MNKNELIEISDIMFKNINYYVIQHNFKIEVYDITNDFNNLNFKIFNGDRLEIMTNFIEYIFGTVIIRTIITGLNNTITVFVRDKKELKK